jgi:precorrin-6B methylase 2
LSPRKLFGGVDLRIEDLYLLEPFQIEYFEGWVPEREFAAVLWAHPPIERFLREQAPAASNFLDDVKGRFGPASGQRDLAKAEDVIVWTIADVLVYNKCPEVYDGLKFHDWDFVEVTSITPLTGKVVVDVGSGTGRVALEAATMADAVVAVEPVDRLRKFIREKAARHGLGNVSVVEGFCHSIPLPDASADVVITSHALGWRLEDELREFERVAMPGGYVIHCPGTDKSEVEQHDRLTSAEWGYEFARYRESDGWKRKYWKRV